MCIPWFWFTCMSSDFISSFQFILPNYKLLGFVSKKEEKNDLVLVNQTSC